MTRFLLEDMVRQGWRVYHVRRGKYRDYCFYDVIVLPEFEDYIFVKDKLC